jgi:hypothetical protein
MTRAAAIVKLEKDLQTRERKLKMAVLQLSEQRSSVAEEFLQERKRLESEFEMRERALQAKLADSNAVDMSLPPLPSAAAADLPAFHLEPGSVLDPSSAIEALAPVAPWAADQLETASRADNWVLAQRKAHQTTVASEASGRVSSNEVLSMWSNRTADASTSMYYSSDEEDSFPLDNNAAIQYLERKQSLKIIREKAYKRSTDIIIAEQSLSDAEQQLKQVLHITRHYQALFS